MNSKIISKIALTVASATCFFMPAMLSAQTIDNNEAVMMGGDEVSIMETAPAKRRQPQLMTMKTAKVLESWALGYSGSGNITDASSFSDFIGSFSIGLGEIAELGYFMEDHMSPDLSRNRIEMGQFKMQFLKESELFPAMSIAVGKNVGKSFQTDLGVDYRMDHVVYDIMASKAFEIGDRMLNFFPGVSFVDDKVFKYNGEEVKINYSHFNYLAGMTLSFDDNKSFMLEGQFYKSLDENTLLEEEIQFQNVVEANAGVRVHLRTWLAIDAGFRRIMNLDEGSSNTLIHANLTGAIPLATAAERISSYF